MVEVEANSESETSENSSLDELKTPGNEATEYETQREKRISHNKARMEALGLQKLANSLVDLSEKDRKRKSKRGAAGNRRSRLEEEGGATGCGTPEQDFLLLQSSLSSTSNHAPNRRILEELKDSDDSVSNSYESFDISKILVNDEPHEKKDPNEPYSLGPNFQLG